MADTPTMVFYDGHCAHCHGLVRFLIARDPARGKFLGAPLQGEYCAAVNPQTMRLALPDSIVVRTNEARLRVKSSAVLYVLERIGGAWRALSITGNVFPTAILECGYDLVARMRGSPFRTTVSTCPLVPANLQNRFRP